MALTVSACAWPAVAAPGNVRSCYILVSVIDATGVPVTGLVMPYFVIGSVTVPAGGALSRLLYADPAGPAALGAYLLQIQPAGGVNWIAGNYAWSVDVTLPPPGVDTGRATCAAKL